MICNYRLFKPMEILGLVPAILIFSSCGSIGSNREPRRDSQGASGPVIVKPTVVDAKGFFVLNSDPTKIGTVLSVTGDAAVLIAKNMSKAVEKPANAGLAAKKFEDLKEDDHKTQTGKNIICHHIPVQEGAKIKLSASGEVEVNVRCDLSIVEPDAKSTLRKLIPTVGSLKAVSIVHPSFDMNDMMITLERGSEGSKALAEALLGGRVRQAVPDLATKDPKDILRQDFESRSNSRMSCSNVPDFDATTKKVIVKADKIVSKWDCTHFFEDIASGTL